jgi:hypothetical protein
MAATFVYPPIPPDQLKIKEEESLVKASLPSGRLFTKPDTGKRVTMASKVATRLIDISQGRAGRVCCLVGAQGARIDAGVVVHAIGEC